MSEKTKFFYSQDSILNFSDTLSSKDFLAIHLNNSPKKDSTNRDFFKMSFRYGLIEKMDSSLIFKNSEGIGVYWQPSFDDSIKKKFFLPNKYGLLFPFKSKDNDVKNIECFNELEIGQYVTKVRKVYWKEIKETCYIIHYHDIRKDSGRYYCIIVNENYGILFLFYTNGWNSRKIYFPL